MKMQSRTRAIDKLYKRRDRYEIPEWQRQEVWNRSKKQKLIDSVLRGWKLPKFYFLKVSDDPEAYEVVDGQQRLVAIFDFFDNELGLPESAGEEFGGSYYMGLPDDLSDAFDDYEIEFDEIEDATEEEVKDFFQRLQEGLPLTSAEKLNSVHSKLRNYVDKLAKHRFFGTLFTTFLHELNRQVELGQNATDRDYLEFQRTINANIKEGARIRHQILIRKFLAHDPEVANLLDPASIAESVNKKEIAAVADPIIKRVGEINDQYAAQHGKDLFKATNRTVQAQTNLSKTITDFNGYKSFIGDLYFLFWESVGSRLDGRMPPSFEDVKMLRTGPQHDVDHGKGTKVKSKKLKIGQVFKNYAGAPSPAGLDPERFVLVQANLLGALRQDLQQMKP